MLIMTEQCRAVTYCIYSLAVPGVMPDMPNGNDDFMPLPVALATVYALLKPFCSRMPVGSQEDGSTNILYYCPYISIFVLFIFWMKSPPNEVLLLTVGREKLGR
jgi:hypothetical protein